MSVIADGTRAVTAVVKGATSNMDTSREDAYRGLLKLMLRLPALRGQLRLLWKDDPSLGHLCEAYEDATATLERLTGNSACSTAGLVEEYLDVCRALEADVEIHCRAAFIRSGTHSPNH